MTRLQLNPPAARTLFVLALLTAACATLLLPPATCSAITIDNPPAVTAPSTQAVETGVLLVFGVSATDPDGDAITSLTAAPLPAGATFTPDAANTHGTFGWSPDFNQAGSYLVTFTACNVLCGSAVTTIAVQNAIRPPVVVAPGTASTSEGVALTFDVTATDAEGGHVTLTAPGLPPGATFVDHGDNTGTFAWVPDYSQAGDYTISFVGTVASGLSSTATTAIHVANTNRAPVAEAGGPYTGFVNVPVTLDGSQSYDPDGDPLTFYWDLGDGDAGSGAIVAHAYRTSASYRAHLTVTDPAGLTGTDSVFVQITGSSCGATAFTVGGNKVIRLNSGRPTWCAQFQPLPGCFPIELIDLSSFVMTNAAVYPSPVIHAITDKTIVKSDLNGDGAPEITVCFAKEDLRTLFAGLPAGTSIVPVSIEASAIYGSHVYALCNVAVLSTGGALAANVTPNPLRASGQLQFTTGRPGALRVRLFDVHGRLVRTLLDDPAAGAGSHGITIDGRDGAGAALSAGIYFYRIETPGARETGRLVIAR